MGQARDDNIIGRMRTECWITKATATYSGCVIHVLIALQRPQQLRERASIYVIDIMPVSLISALLTVGLTL
jgi:hypothetical protein